MTTHTSIFYYYCIFFPCLSFVARDSESGACVLPGQKRRNGVEGAFSQHCYWQFHGLWRSTWNNFVAAVRAPRMFRMFFFTIFVNL